MKAKVARKPVRHAKRVTRRAAAKKQARHAPAPVKEEVMEQKVPEPEGTETAVTMAEEPVEIVVVGTEPIVVEEFDVVVVGDDELE